MKVDIITPDQTVFTGDAESVRVPGIQGSFEVLSGHAPLVSILSEGNIFIRMTKGELKSFKSDSGVIEVLNNRVVILCETVVVA